MLRGSKRFNTVEEPMPRFMTCALLLTAVTAASFVAATTGESSAATGTYYVAPNGDDSAAGTDAAPWRTIAHAQSVVVAGDTGSFRGGTYAYTTATKACASRTD